MGNRRTGQDHVRLAAVGIALRALPKTAAWAVALGGSLATYAFHDELARVPWALGIVPAAMLFALGGRALWPRYRALRGAHAVSGVLLVAGVVLVTRDASAPLDMKQSDLGTPVLSFVVALAMSFAIIDLCNAMVARIDWLRPVATALAVPAVLVVLTHSAVLQALNTPPEGRAVDFVAAAVLPWAAALAVQRIGWLRTPLLGSPKPRVPADQAAAAMPDGR